MPIVFEKKRNYHTHINIAPLVDVVFLLLLFFLLTSRLVYESGIKINLPKSATAEEKNVHSITISVTADGEIYFLEEKVDLENLSSKIIDYSNRENINIEKDFLKIKVDKKVNVGLLIKVIDKIKFAGIRNFFILTEKDYK